MGTWVILIIPLNHLFRLVGTYPNSPQISWNATLRLAFKYRGDLAPEKRTS